MDDKELKPLFLEEKSPEYQAYSTSPEVQIIDQYKNMAEELLNIRTFSKDRTPIKKGRWVFFPWSNQLLHILDSEDFQELRTARNQNLITKEEQKKFNEFKVGVVGLSVGNSIALSLVYSGGCEILKLADLDTLSFSNLNRIRAQVSAVGLNKVFLAAQQIYSINPYSQLTLFPKGLNDNNLTDFFGREKSLNLIIEESDDFEMKVRIRQKAKEKKIPVMMVTDSGENVLIDVERFDLEENRPIFHGLVDLEKESLTNLSKQDKVRLATQVVSKEYISERMFKSLNEVGKTLETWPQLGTTAFAGGGIGAFTAMKIASGEFKKSGRVYFNFENSLSPLK